MSDLLLELYCEEIPASMQRNAAHNLKKQVTDILVDKGLTYEAACSYWTPRRLVLDIRNLSNKSQDVREVRKGPSTKAPQKAIDGFLRSVGLQSTEDAQILTDPKKGTFYSAEIIHKGQYAAEILAQNLPQIIRNFSWPKSMRWGEASAREGALHWVRPMHSILCVLSSDTESEIVDFSVGDIQSGNYTFGHPFMYGREPIHVRRFDDYAAKLTEAKVILDAERRKEIILADAHNLCFAQGLELVEDDRLADEVAGLVEWPIVLMGSFDKSFLSIPAEIIRLTIRANQKCFVTRPMQTAMSAHQQIEQMPEHSHSDALANAFILTANIEPQDNGKEIIKGNGKVVHARLSDALYFWETDQKPLPDLPLLESSAEKLSLDLYKPLDQRAARLDSLNVTFHAKLGSQGDRIARIVALASKIAPLIGADRTAVRRAAVLSKADLQTEAVGEFPELQGVMGHKYALLQNEEPAVAAAIEEHYKPQGPKDFVPRNPVSIAVALADKIDTLVGFWLINEKPTGSKDPYALRRAALGVVRLALSQEFKLDLMPLFHEAAHLLQTSIIKQHMLHFAQNQTNSKKIQNRDANTEISYEEEERRFEEHLLANANPILDDLLVFFHERFKVWLKEEGARYDAIDAVLTPQADNLLQVARKIETLISFINSDDGASMLSGAKRAFNILKAEEEKGAEIASEVDPVEFVVPEEVDLYNAVFQAEKQIRPLLEDNNFKDALRVLAKLRMPVDAFFDNVMVNDENPRLRANRLAVLKRIRHLISQYADFSKLNG